MIMVAPKKDMSYREWVCGKCGLKRNNRCIHIHGVPLKDVVSDA